MEKDIETTSSNSSAYDLLTSFAQNAIFSVFTNADAETIKIACCATFAIIGATTYVYYKMKDNSVKYSAKSNRPKKEKNMKNYDSHHVRSCFYDKSKQDSFDYHKLLTEFHNASDNCSNIFSSMKCIQLTSDYPELINVKLYSDGITPFHRVCSRGNELLIEFMLAKGADPELRTVAGENALCKTLYHYLFTGSVNFNCLNILMRRGCRFNYNDDWYEIFLKLAIKYDNKNLAEWLITHSKSQTPNVFNRASSAPL